MLSDDLRLEVGYCIAAANLSQAHVARTLGVTTKHLCQMLAGKAPMSIYWAERIVNVCGYRLVIRSEPVEVARSGHARLRSSGGERHSDEVEAAGSSPAATT